MTRRRSILPCSGQSQYAMKASEAMQEGCEDRAAVDPGRFEANDEAEEINGERENPEEGNGCDVLGEMGGYGEQKDGGRGGES